MCITPFSWSGGPIVYWTGATKLYMLTSPNGSCEKHSNCPQNTQKYLSNIATVNCSNLLTFSNVWTEFDQFYKILICFLEIGKLSIADTRASRDEFYLMYFIRQFPSEGCCTLKNECCHFRSKDNRQICRLSQNWRKTTSSSVQKHLKSLRFP